MNDPFSSLGRTMVKPAVILVLLVINVAPSDAFHLSFRVLEPSQGKDAVSEGNNQQTVKEIQHGNNTGNNQKQTVNLLQGNSNMDIKGSQQTPTLHRLQGNSSMDGSQQIIDLLQGNSSVDRTGSYQKQTTDILHGNSSKGSDLQSNSSIDMTGSQQKQTTSHIEGISSGGNMGIYQQDITDLLQSNSSIDGTGSYRQQTRALVHGNSSFDIDTDFHLLNKTLETEINRTRPMVTAAENPKMFGSIDNLQQTGIRKEQNSIPAENQHDFVQFEQARVGVDSKHTALPKNDASILSGKKESIQNKEPAIAAYKMDVKRKEMDKPKKFLTLEQRIAAWLLQQKEDEWTISKDAKKRSRSWNGDAPEKAKVEANPDGFDVGNKESDGSSNESDTAEQLQATNTGKHIAQVDKSDVNFSDKNSDGTYKTSKNRGIKELKKEDVLLDSGHIPKYVLYDEVEKTENSGIEKNAKNQGTDNGNEKENKNRAHRNDGKQISNSKEEDKHYDYYYDSDRPEVAESTRQHYGYYEKGYNKDSTIFYEDKQKSKDIMKKKQTEKFTRQSEILHDTGSFHTVENFVDDVTAARRSGLANRKSKTSSENSKDDDSEVIVSAFKIRVTRMEDQSTAAEEIPHKGSSLIEKISRVGISNPVNKDKDKEQTSKENIRENEQEQSRTEKERNIVVKSSSDETLAEIQSDAAESLSIGDGLSDIILSEKADFDNEVKDKKQRQTGSETDKSSVDEDIFKDYEKNDETVKDASTIKLPEEEVPPEEPTTSSSENEQNQEETLKTWKSDTENVHSNSQESHFANVDSLSPEQALLQKDGKTSIQVRKDVALPEAYLATWTSTVWKNSSEPKKNSTFEVLPSPTQKDFEANKDNRDDDAEGGRTGFLAHTNKTNIEKDSLKVNAEQHKLHLQVGNSGNINANIITRNNSSITKLSNNHAANSNTDITNASTSSERNTAKDKSNATQEKVTVKVTASERKETASSSRETITERTNSTKVSDQSSPADDLHKTQQYNRTFISSSRNVTQAVPQSDSMNITEGRSDTQLSDQPARPNLQKMDLVNGRPNNSQVKISVDAREGEEPSLSNQSVISEDLAGAQVKKVPTPYRSRLNSAGDSSTRNITEIRNAASNISMMPSSYNQSKVQDSISRNDSLRKYQDERKNDSYTSNNNITSVTQRNSLISESRVSQSNLPEARYGTPIKNEQPMEPMKVSQKNSSSSHTSNFSTTSRTFENISSPGEQDDFPVRHSLQLPQDSKKNTSLANTTDDIRKRVSSSSSEHTRTVTSVNKSIPQSPNGEDPVSGAGLPVKSSSILNNTTANNELNKRNQNKNTKTASKNEPYTVTNDNHRNNNFKESNISAGVNTARKLLSVSETDVHEVVKNKTPFSSTFSAQKFQTNGTPSASASSFAKVSGSTLLKQTNASAETSKGNVTIEDEHDLSANSSFNDGERVNITYLRDIQDDSRRLGNASTVFPRPKTAHTIPSELQQNTTWNKSMHNSHHRANKDIDGSTRVTGSAVKTSSSVNGTAAMNKTPKSFVSREFDLQPEVMANERQHQSRTQNQKFIPDSVPKEVTEADTPDSSNSKSDNDYKESDDVSSNNQEEKTKSSGEDISIDNTNDENGDTDADNVNHQHNGGLSNSNPNDEINGQNNKRSDNNQDVKSDNDDNRNNGEDNTNDSSKNTVLNTADANKSQSPNEANLQTSDQGKSDLQENNAQTDTGDVEADLLVLKNLTTQPKAAENSRRNQRTKNEANEDSQNVNNMQSLATDPVMENRQNHLNAKGDDINENIPSTNESRSSQGLRYYSSAPASGKVPEITPYRIQDFSLLKPTSDKKSTSKENNTDKSKSTTTTIADTTNSFADSNRNGSKEDGSNASSPRSECDVGCSLGAGVSPQRAQAAVSAVLTTHFGPTKDQMIPFDLELLDLADNYDNTTGMFICTIPGTYVISLYLMSHPGAKVNARVLINNRPIAALWADDAKNAGFYPSSSTQTIAQLAFGDQVYVMLVDGGYGDSWVHANYNVFTIFLLYEHMF